MSIQASSLAREQFVWALEAMCRPFQMAFDEAIALQQSPPPHTLDSLATSARALGLRTKYRSVGLDRLSKMQPPFLLLLHPERERSKERETPPSSATSDSMPGDLVPALVVKVADDEIWMVESVAAAPKCVSRESLAMRYAGGTLAFAPEPKPIANPDAPSAGRTFGFSWFGAALLEHRNIWGEVLLASFAIQAVSLAVPLCTQLVIDKVVVHQTMNTLVVIGTALAMVAVFTAVMSWLRQYLVLRVGNVVDARLGAQVFEHLLSLPPRYFERRPTGTLVARLHGVEVIREFVSGAAATLLLDCPFVLVFVAIMFFYSWELSLVALAVLALLAAVSALIAPMIRSRLNGQFLLGARNQAFLTEYVSAMETVKSLQMEPQLRENFKDYLWSYLEAGFKTRQLSNSYGVLANTLEQLMTLLVLVLGAWMVMQNDGFTIGMLVAFQMFAGRLAQPMLRLAGLWQEFQRAAIAVKRLGDIMNVPSEPYSTVPTRSPSMRADIEIENLGFRYAPQLPFLFRNLCLNVRQGSCVAIMGPSGCGKSTLAKLLQGFYPVSEGGIRIGGRDIRHLSANELRLSFGVVPQETVLFSGTIYENLIRANPHASFGDVMEACRSASIHDVIEALPEGYATCIGEHGAGLSGGQRQRLAIARALLKRPKVLIFDEATSHLDAGAAAGFVAAVNLLKGRVTLLFIAHDLPPGLDVDETVWLAGSTPGTNVSDAASEARIGSRREKQNLGSG